MKIFIIISFIFLSSIFLGCSNNDTTSSDNNQEVSTLSIVEDRGRLFCGVSPGIPGFSAPDSRGQWTGIDVDICKAVAAAVLGDATKVRYTPLTGKERFTALQSGEIDMLSRNSTWTQYRDTALGINFTEVTYYDGQGFLVKKDLGLKSALELGGASVCVQAGTTTELNLADYFRFNNLPYNSVVFDTPDQVQRAFDEGRCDVLTSDKSQLAALRISLADPDASVLLPEIISKEPLSSAVRQGDDQWFNIVKWTVNALIEAEELGLDSQNIDAMINEPSISPNVKRFLGIEGKLGENLGLNPDWSYQIIKQVGNYGEIFERNVGPNTLLKLDRGINNLWTEGGIRYAKPFR